MTSGGQSGNRAAQGFAILAAIGFPTIFGFAWTQTGDVLQALGLMVVYGGVVAIAGLVTGVWQRLQPKLIDGAADAIEKRFVIRGEGKFRREYLQYLIFSHRNFDVKGLSIQGPFNLDLERVFVDLEIGPGNFPNPTLIPSGELEKGGHSIWDYLNAEQFRNFAIVGVPGSGKTTLVKFIALSLAARERRSHEHIPDKLPVLLFLRNHAKVIAADPKIRLAVLIRDSLERMEEEVPEGWFEGHLKNGKCIVMLDGLDEVADSEMRQAVVAWVEEQMQVHHNNRFITTSRPHGYRSNPLSGVTQLSVRPFNRTQIRAFANNWYLATETMRSQKSDAGVAMDAQEGADDLLKRLENAPDLAELAVNPLLLTMIANVHHFRSRLPGRRVELYAEMCEVFLGKAEQARNLPIELTPAQKQSILQPLAYTMMLRRTRELPLDEVLAIIAGPLKLVPVKISGVDFVEMICDRSSILIERESDMYSFAHKTFQEFLTAIHIERDNLGDELLLHLEDDWWHETIRLFCARMDATPIIAACLRQQPPPLKSLVLATECLEEALKVEPETRRLLEKVLEEDIESHDLERRQLAAKARLARRLRRLNRLDANTYVDSSLITHAEYQLFLDEYPDAKPYYWDNSSFSTGEGLKPIVGVTSAQAQVFCDWLSEREIDKSWYYRLPEVKQHPQMGNASPPALEEREVANIAPYWMVEKIGETQQVRLAEKRLISETVQHWLIEGDQTNKIEAFTSFLSQQSVDGTFTLVDYLIENHFEIVPNRVNFARALDRALALNRALEHARDLARKLDRDLARDLDNALARDRAFDRWRARALARALAYALVRAGGSASDLANDLDHALALDRANAPDLARALDRTLAYTVMDDPDSVDLMSLFQTVARIITGYIISSIMLNSKSRFPVAALFQSVEWANAFRQALFQQVIDLVKNEPKRLRSGNNQEWDGWKATVDWFWTAYCYLAAIEKRRRGEWEAFEGIWIVKARRMDDDSTKK